MGEEGSLAQAFASPGQSPGRARPSQCSSPVGRQASSSVVHKFYFTYPRSIPIKSPCSTLPIVLMSKQSCGVDTHGRQEEAFAGNEVGLPSGHDPAVYFPKIWP